MLLVVVVIDDLLLCLISKLNLLIGMHAWEKTCVQVSVLSAV